MKSFEIAFKNGIKGRKEALLKKSKGEGGDTSEDDSNVGSRKKAINALDTLETKVKGDSSPTEIINALEGLKKIEKQWQSEGASEDLKVFSDIIRDLDAEFSEPIRLAKQARTLVDSLSSIENPDKFLDTLEEIKTIRQKL